MKKPPKAVTKGEIGCDFDMCEGLKKVGLLNVRLNRLFK